MDWNGEIEVPLVKRLADNQGEINDSLRLIIDNQYEMADQIKSLRERVIELESRVISDAEVQAIIADEAYEVQQG